MSAGDKIKALTEKYERLSRMLDIEETNRNQLVIQQKYLTKGSQFFVHKDMDKHGMKLVHSIYYGEQLRAFRKGIETDDYEFYDEYPYCPEILIVGSSNAGKSSLINALNDTVDTSKVSKRSGKTQCLNFFLCQKQAQFRNKKDVNDVWRGLIIDSPGYGHTYAPVKVKNQFKKLMSGYLSHAVRLNMVFMLVNAETGLKHCDIEMLEKLEYYRKPCQVVFSKVDKVRGGRSVLQANLEKTGLEI